MITTAENGVWATKDGNTRSSSNGGRPFTEERVFGKFQTLTRTTLGSSSLNLERDSDRPRAFIERDSRFENDIENITGTILKDFFRTNESNAEIKKRFIQPINEALRNIFGEGNGTKLQLIEIIPPLEGKVAQINFEKGRSKIHYDF